MAGLTIYPLRFTLEAIDEVVLGEQAGAQIRGTLYTALREHMGDLPIPEQGVPSLDVDPVRWLLAREDESAERGKDVPRAFAVQPPLDSERRYPPETHFTVGITLFGRRTLALLPFIVLAFPHMGRLGMGYRRGRFYLHHVTLLGADGCQTLLMPPGSDRVQTPQSGITHEQIAQRAALLSRGRLTLHFQTPTRLIHEGRLLKAPLFHVLMARLLERYDLIGMEYGDGFTPVPPEQRADLLRRAERIQLVEDRTRWQDVFSHSRRTGSSSPISGLVGEATYSGDLTPFREWLLWGSYLQIGKNTAKGDGWYSVR
ncbi:MAG: CRISPR system precrRNA processing endoribonuclease RAMP protein Cas6 [Anaerolineae bacterium]|nr:CRISPR system precrRNA processing endoribonuclease RAMP protein Cas6 [Anaerolineae bacterium]MDW8300535.1 CRISPR system precrRNA processing endoribonuclease RAMP protein Cas6 [Anaerolineae bacterium]